MSQVDRNEAMSLETAESPTCASPSPDWLIAVRPKIVTAVPKYITCRECGTEFDADDVCSEHADAELCAECGHACTECGRIQADSELEPSYNGDVCKDCAEEYYVWSDVHDTYISRYDAVIADDTGRVAHEAYAEEHWFQDSYGTWFEEPPNGSVLSYPTSPLDYFTWDPRNSRDALVFGVELEMEARADESAAEIVELLGGPIGRNFILKEDGSLVAGVELVTMPFTLKQHRTEFGWQDLLSSDLREIAMSGAGTNRCGMHIHINRAALTPLTIGKMMVFCHSPRNEHLIRTIAQREPCSYAQVRAKKFSDGGKPTDRYERVNVSGKGTVELRMFRGNLRPERVIKNIEFAHALVTYCRQASMLDIENPEAFLSFVTQYRKDYPALFSFLVERGVLSPSTEGK